jgi:cytochrome c oxidase cbb3-type subunit II
VVPESVMPSYSFLKNTELDIRSFSTTATLRANLLVGVPYNAEMLENAEADIKAQADPNADTAGLLERYPKAKVGDFDGDPSRVTEMDALVAYLQMLGTLVDFSTYNDASGYR